jgi:hypothetical protein
VTIDDFDAIANHVDPLKEAIEALGFALVAVIVAYPAGDGAKLGVLGDPDCPKEVMDTVTRRLNVKKCATRGGKK